MKRNLFKILSIALIVSFFGASCHDESESPIPKLKPKAGFIVLVDPMHNAETIRLFNVSQNETNIYWDFGDGNTSNVDVKEHTYSNPGIYIVTLKALNKNYTDTFSDTISIIQSSNHNYIFADNKAIIEDTCGCAPFEAFFEFKNDGAWIKTYWKFGDQSSTSNNSSENKASHKYVQAGFYKIDLEIQNSDTSISYSASKLYVFKPVAYFACTPQVSYNSVPDIKFYNISENCRNSYWSFGDGFVSKELNPTHKYEMVGDFTVKLFVQDKYGCIDTTSFIVSNKADD